MQTALPERALAGARAGARLAAVAPFLLGALLTGLLAGDHGGYWPTSWGWTTLALVWAAALAIVLRDGLASRLELAWIGGLVALIGWTALSWFWTASRTQTALEVERTLVYVGTAVAAVAVVRSAGYRSLLWGVWAGATAASLYGLATRLLPERLGVTDVIAGYRLSSPVGYWNGLGLLTAVAATLALGLAALGRPAAGKAAASASLPLLVATLYFTFSRGAWIALAAALIAAVAISSRRLQLISALLVQAIPATAALVLAYGAKPLRRLDVPASQATHAGHTLAWKLMLVSLAASAITLAYARVAGRMRFPEAVRRAYAGLLAAAVLFGLGAVLVHYGGPAATLSHIKRSIDRSPPAQGSDLSTRLFTLSSGGRLRQWHVALDEWRAHPALGGGAGTYAEYWAAAGTNQGQLLDVHNLYLETLAELGPIGLALLVVTLLVPLVAAVRARDRTLTAIATGAYVAWLVHAGYDWDWELPGVTVAAILCAGAVLAAARGRGRTGPATWTRWTLLVVALGVGIAALLGLLGNRALARSSDALRKGNVAAAAAAAEDARHWAPWSAQPWKQLASVRIAQGDRAGALTAYRKAVAKDPRDWELWLGLTSVSRGAERARALARLAVLDPGAASSSSTGSP